MRVRKPFAFCSVVVYALLGVQGCGSGSNDTVDESSNSISASTSDLPCDVQEALSTNCWKCHNNPTNWGAPMPLVTQEDFLAMGTVTKDAVVADLVKARINTDENPMPPITEPAMSESDLAVLNQWLDSDTKKGSDKKCGTFTGTGGMEGNVMENPGDVDPYANVEPWTTEPGWPGGKAPKETCYQFLKHGAQSPTDTTPMVTPEGEYYVTFYYKVPWTEPMVMTKWRTVYDQTQILHHWLLFESRTAASNDGTFATPVPASSLLAGVHLTSGNLVAGWAVGGGADTLPEGVGMKMPPPGGMFELEWHLWNSTGGDVADRSGVELCVVPESEVDPKYVAGMTWLGTEDLALPPNQTTQRGGICTPSLPTGDPATIVLWSPHMHLLGTHMDTWVMHEDGSEDHVFGKPFQFDFQIAHRQDPPYEVKSGDRLHSVCTFDNTTSSSVAYGQSTTTEMCYQFVVAYPAGALNGIGGDSLVLSGANNGCGLRPNDMTPVHEN